MAKAKRRKMAVKEISTCSQLHTHSGVLTSLPFSQCWHLFLSPGQSQKTPFLQHLKIRLPLKPSTLEIGKLLINRVPHLLWGAIKFWMPKGKRWYSKHRIMSTRFHSHNYSCPTLNLDHFMNMQKQYTGTFDPDHGATRLPYNPNYNHQVILICRHVSFAELWGGP